MKRQREDELDMGVETAHSIHVLALMIIICTRRANSDFGKILRATATLQHSFVFWYITAEPLFLCLILIRLTSLTIVSQDGIAGLKHQLHALRHATLQNLSV